MTLKIIHRYRVSWGNSLFHTKKLHTHTHGVFAWYMWKKSNYPVCWLLFAWQKRRAEMVETLVWKDSNECMCSYLLINLRIACGTLVKSEMQAREVKCKQWLKMGNLMLRSYASVIKFSWRVLIMKHGQRLTRDLDWVSNHKNSKVQLVWSNSSNPLGQLKTRVTQHNPSKI